MRAGYGKSELTPPMGVELAGYGYYLGRCAQSVRDPLLPARCCLRTAICARWSAAVTCWA